MSAHEKTAESPQKQDLHQESNLTSNQLQVWIAQTLLPEVPIYNLAVALYLEGEIDPEHFDKAFRVLIDSSDALPCRFCCNNAWTCSSTMFFNC